MKDLFKNAFAIDAKKLSLAVVSEKIYEKWFVPAGKFVSTPGINHSLKIPLQHMEKLLLPARKSKKMVSTCRKMFFF